jgi:hypothetical protein
VSCCGAGDAVAALLARDPAGHVSLNGPRAVASLLGVLDAIGAGDAVPALSTRAASAGTFDLFPKVCPGEASRYPVGREPDGAPSRAWNWLEPACQNRSLRRQPPGSGGLEYFIHSIHRSPESRRQTGQIARSSCGCVSAPGFPAATRCVMVWRKPGRGGDETAGTRRTSSRSAVASARGCGSRWPWQRRARARPTDGHGRRVADLALLYGSRTAAKCPAAGTSPRIH